MHARARMVLANLARVALQTVPQNALLATLAGRLATTRPSVFGTYAHAPTEWRKRAWVVRHTELQNVYRATAALCLLTTEARAF